MLDKHIFQIRTVNPDLKTKTIIEKGSPGIVITEVAKREKVDLIVLGSKGFRVDDWSLGTISDSVVNLSSVNVLVVK